MELKSALPWLLNKGLFQLEFTLKVTDNTQPIRSLLVWVSLVLEREETRTLTPAPLLPNAIKGKIQGVAEDDVLKARPE